MQHGWTKEEGKLAIHWETQETLNELNNVYSI